MTPQKLKINPSIRILHRQGALFAAQLSGTAQPMQLLEFDVVLLSLFFTPTTPQQAADELLRGDTRRLLPAVPGVQALLGRMHQLFQAGVLQLADNEAESGAGDEPVQALDDCPGIAEETGSGPLRIGANIALRPGTRSYRAWSPARRKVFHPGIELVLLMLRFATDQPAAEVAAAPGLPGDRLARERGIAWLLNAGLLVRSQQKARTSAVRGQPVVTAKRLNGPRWQDLEPDERIPVYFTPHMENHYPLALGMIAAAINDFEDGALLERFQLLPISFMEPQQLFEGPYRRFGPGVWLFSNYMWSLDINLQISGMLKSRDGGSLTIHGGPSTPGYPAACAEFMAKNPSVDFAVHGEGEVAVTELLAHVHRDASGRISFDTEGMREVQGLTYRSDTTDGGLVTTPTRTRLKAPDSIPSPYLTGVFDSYDGAVEAAIIESNRGCPFGCTFCDWGSATRQKVRKFDLERVKQEIEWIGRNRVRVIWIADANFGMYDRDIELAEYIVETKKQHGYPLEVVVNYTKNTTRRLVEIIKAFSAGGIISQGIISIQTTDEATLEVINRRNIKTEVYDELTGVFADANLPLSTDLMIGLPGITPAAFDRDLQRYFDVDVSTKAYPTQLLPNSPMADPEYMEKYQIKVDKDNFVIACHSFNEQELADMKAIFRVFEVADGYAVLRYVLRYLQWEHGIKALAFLHRVLDETTARPADWPAISWVMKFFTTDKILPGGWRGFYDEIAKLAHEAYGVARDSAFDTVLLANEMAMPDDTIDYPLTLPLAHDFVAWFRDHNGQAVREVRPLSDYPPGEFTVDDPDGMASIDMDYIQYDSHQYFWELRSATARAKSVSDVKELAHAATGN
ncbi:MAG: radical SAM protein [Xanthomonadales bacterium]|nr:radical SAM protein [Xanthomonadales bacterium]